MDTTDYTYVNEHQLESLESIGFSFHKQPIKLIKLETGSEFRSSVELEEIFRKEAADEFKFLPTVAEVVQWFRDQKGARCYIDIEYWQTSDMVKYIGKVVDFRGEPYKTYLTTKITLATLEDSYQKAEFGLLNLLIKIYS